MWNPFKYFKDLKNKIMFRAFLAGVTNRLNTGWITSTLTTNEELKRYLPKLIERSRDLSKNNSDYRKWLTMREINIFGHTGFNLQVKSVNPDDRPDKMANQLIESHFKRWGKKKNGWCTIDGQQSFLDFCCLVDRTLAVDGECFVRIIEGADNPYLFSLQIIDTFNVDMNKNIEPANKTGNKIVMGIELDRNDRPVAYWIKDNPNAYYSGNTVRVPAKQIIHIYRKEFAGQVRGFPLGCAAIMDINMQQGYREAELVGARIAASQMGIWEQQANGGKLLPDKTGADVKPATEVQPGKFVIAPKGWTFKQFTPTHPGQNFSDFIKTVMRSIANGLNVAYNDFANDLEKVNFSSLRGGTINERDCWKKAQTFFIENFLEIVYSRWLKMFLLSGLTNLPFSKFEKFDNVQFAGRRWQWVDPMKDARANEIAIKNLVKSPQEVIREQGGDPDDVLAEIADFEKKANELGLSLFKVDTSQNKKGDTQNA